MAKIISARELELIEEDVESAIAGPTTGNGHVGQ